MILYLLSYLGGTLTILSPCVLPVVPFLFAKTGRSFWKSGFPILLGMGASFSIFATLSVVGGRWVVQANEYGRIFALLFFAITGMSLVFPVLLQKITAPIVSLGGNFQTVANRNTGIFSSVLIGLSVGLLWAPCAGPILGLVLAGAALERSIGSTFGLLLAFAMGASTSMAVILFASAKFLTHLKKGFLAEEWIRRGVGTVVLVSVVLIAFGVDTKILSSFSYFNTGNLEQGLIDNLSGSPNNLDKGRVPTLKGANEWLNSPPLELDSLKGKVVLIDFWTYSCVNCLRTLPYLKNWSEKYRNQGLVVIGVHTPEFAFERESKNIKNATDDLGISYPIAVDNDQVIWNSFKNRYWPAHYFIDRKGRIRHHHFGEGNYAESEKVIQELLKEGASNPQMSPLDQNSNPEEFKGSGVEAPSVGSVNSPETYLGYARQEGFVSTPRIIKDVEANYKEPKTLSLNQWSLGGRWKFSGESALLSSRAGLISFRFEARDLHLVIGSRTGKPIRFRVRIDGHSPNGDHGTDIDANGKGVVEGHRLYQLVRQKDGKGQHTFQIEFLDPGAEVFAFTFG